MEDFLIEAINLGIISGKINCKDNVIKVFFITEKLVIRFTQAFQEMFN